MREKIREDVTTALENLIEEHSDVFYRYEISDDFRQVRIYEASGIMDIHNMDIHMRHELRIGIISRIRSLIGLYHSIKTGGPASMPTNFTFDIIAPSE